MPLTKHFVFPYIIVNVCVLIPNGTFEELNYVLLIFEFPLPNLAISISYTF